ncbi:ABC transporter permease [Cereibacter azotoformans]|uniref:ABC transporter permease n=1 Tax=Cereibacter azotoformans TaxID=43057 RepID=UPI001EECC026|nr:ABC transporter permease [Cereibacter azotoformans]ULB11719.1 ABC transporter permease [Cereibacter azotoformans]
MSGALSQLGFRLAQALGVALVVGLLSFLMMQALPGDAAFRIAAGRYGYDLVTAEAAAAVRAELGLDRGPVAAFLGWMADLARLNLGTSLVSGERVAEEIAHQLGATLQLAGAALALSLLIGPPLGLWAGLHAGGRFDRALLVASAAFRSVPQFLMGLVLIVVLAVQFRLLPAAGHGAPAHFVLPALTLALGLAAASARITRDAMARVEASPHYAFARWKGLSERQVLWRHGLRNVAAPVLTFLGMQFVTLAEGVVVVETIFGWPGIGHALIHAVFHRDVPMVQGTALVMGLGFVLVNALTDVAVRRIDPRGVGQ